MKQQIPVTHLASIKNASIKISKGSKTK